MLRRLFLVSFALALVACAGSSGGTRDAAADRGAGEGITFRDGLPGLDSSRDATLDVPPDGVPFDGVPGDATLDADAGDGQPLDVTALDSSIDLPPPDSTVDAPPPKCTLYSDWQCQPLSSIVRCTTSCTVGSTERRITCLNSGVCICIKGGQSVGQCTVPATAGCAPCSAAFSSACCNF